VCGCQEFEKSTAKNAARLLAMAFDMLDIVKTVEDPVTKEPIQMRIGIHTGSIVAGA
jgi:class 3 adenylate cyclase